MSTLVSKRPIILFELNTFDKYWDKDTLTSDIWETKEEATIIASVALFSLIATAHLPCSDLISSSVPIIIPPDSSPANTSRGFIPKSIGLPNTSSITTDSVGLFFNLSSTFFIIFAISLNPTGTLTTFTPLFLAHSSQERADAVVLIINLGWLFHKFLAFNCFDQKSINIRKAWFALKTVKTTSSFKLI